MLLTLFKERCLPSTQAAQLSQTSCSAQMDCSLGHCWFRTDRCMWAWWHPRWTEREVGNFTNICYLLSFSFTEKNSCGARGPRPRSGWLTLIQIVDLPVAIFILRCPSKMTTSLINVSVCVRARVFPSIFYLLPTFPSNPWEMDPPPAKRSVSSINHHGVWLVPDKN